MACSSQVNSLLIKSSPSSTPPRPPLYTRPHYNAHQTLICSDPAITNTHTAPTMYNLHNPQRAPGMQIHAVPESERATDSAGRRLPWAYDYSGSAIGDNGERQPLEKGPFGRSMGRSRSRASRSRSKTAEPRREEDRMRLENMAAEDAVFGSLRRTNPKDNNSENKRDVMSEVDPNAAIGQARGNPPSSDAEGEPSEVIIWGYGTGLQWAALEFYERVSNGYILEDYERQPPGQRSNVSRSLGRAAAQKSLSRAAMRKRNKYAGGEHWIKVTFDSVQAADLAIARQPHTIKGHLVYLGHYDGHGPPKDEPIPATQAGAQIVSNALPPTFGIGSMNTSSTASSATATAPSIPQVRAAPLPWNAPLGGGLQNSPTASSNTMQSGPGGNGAPPQMANSTSFQPQQSIQLQPRRLRIDGATRAVILPAELALAPKQPKASWTSWIGASEIIGSAVPRRDDGSFDWNAASLYWKLFWWIDTILGTDFCGLKGDD